MGTWSGAVIEPASPPSGNRLYISIYMEARVLGALEESPSPPWVARASWTIVHGPWSMYVFNIRLFLIKLVHPPIFKSTVFATGSRKKISEH